MDKCITGLSYQLAPPEVKEKYMIDESMEIDMDGFIDSVKEEDTNNAQNGTSTSNGGFQFPTCVGIGNKAIVRFIYGIPASPLEPRFKNPYVAKLVNLSWIKDDEGKNMRMILPAIIGNKPQVPSTMCDFLDAVLTQVWCDFTPEEIAARQADPKLDAKKKNATGEYRFFYKGRQDYGAQTYGSKTLGEIFDFVYKSGHQPGEQYYDSQKSWRGQTVYIANVIDRKDAEWHKANKKTKLLMGSVKLKAGNKITNKEASWYRMSSITDFAKNAGQNMNYDVMIKPVYGPNGAEISNAPYKFAELSSRAEKDYWNDIATDITPEERKLVRGANLSEEEKQMDLIDISMYYRVTPASTIVKRLIKTIDAFDMMAGTNFGERFRMEAKMEEEAKAAQKAVEAPASAPVTQPTVDPQVQATVSQPVAPTAQVTEPASVTTSAPVTPQPAVDSNPYGFAPAPQKAASDFNVDDFYKNLGSN